MQNVPELSKSGASFSGHTIVSKVAINAIKTITYRTPSLRGKKSAIRLAQSLFKLLHNFTHASAISGNFCDSHGAQLRLSGKPFQWLRSWRARSETLTRCSTTSSLAG